MGARRQVQVGRDERAGWPPGHEGRRRAVRSATAPKMLAAVGGRVLNGPELLEFVHEEAHACARPATLRSCWLLRSPRRPAVCGRVADWTALRACEPVH